MVNKIKITFPDGSSKELKNGITGLKIAESISEGLARQALAIKVDDKVWDLSREIKHDAKIQILTFKDKEGLEVFRHSTAHILADAVMQLFPYAKLTIGPVVDEGFYYDIDHEPFTPEDLPKIEEKMKEIIKANHKFERKEISKKEALELFRDNIYKTEMIQELDDDSITIYQHGKFVDLCRGPHVQSTGQIKAVKLTKLAGAYWRADAKNKMLQRIYGISFADKKDLNQYLDMIEEAKKRDHKKIGKELELFMISDMIGKGLPVWLPNGEFIKKQIEKFAIETEEKYGFIRVSTPHLAKEELFLTSGHLPHYKDSMYPPMKMDDGTYYLKAMNCPMHHLIFDHKTRSYRELPLRIAEYGTVYRNELSGTLSGLLRVRMLSMNDAHIYCTKEQIGQEIESVIKMIKEYYEIFGLKDYYFRLSLWDPENKDKYVNEPSNWEYSEEILRNILRKLDVPFTEAKDEAAFYGPKIDIQFKTVLGREETMSTVQLDFVAKTRFKLKYADENGRENPEVFVIHRAPLSTHERFIAFLIEHYAGRFPLWLNPRQVTVLSVSDKSNEYAQQIYDKLLNAGFKVELDLRTESIPKKVRDAQLKQINYILVCGEKDQAAKIVTPRTREGEVQEGIKIDKFIEKLEKEVREKM